MLEDYLNKGIKQVIEEFPELEHILSEYEIDCGTCFVGTCLLKDIVSIHSLAENQEKELIERISAIIEKKPDPGTQKIKTQTKNQREKFHYSPPLQELVDEHLLIKRWLALIPKVADSLNLKTEHGREIVLQGIDMIRSFADRLHHAKEEDILFKYFDESEAIIQVMYADHTTARGFVKSMLNSLETGDEKIMKESLLSYKKLLTQHIQKEDEILYPWMDKNLSVKQIDELIVKFKNAHQRTGIPDGKYESLIKRMEKEL